jgi:hypothetical protein
LIGYLIAILLAAPAMAVSIVPSSIDGGSFNYTQAPSFYFDVTNRFYPYTVNVTFEATLRSFLTRPRSLM